MDSWERFNEKSLPNKEYFYSELNKEGIIKEEYQHALRVGKEFNIKNLGEYHDLYVQSDTALLANVFENFRNKCIEIHKPDPSHFLSAPELALQACLKMTGVKLELLTDNDVLMMIEKATRGGMCNAVYRYAKANNKYMKSYDENIESSFLVHNNANNLYGWPMYKNLPIGGFKWVEKEEKFDENFIRKL